MLPHEKNPFDQVSGFITMPTFRYIFGFESPRQFHNNNQHGWDDEDSKALLIDADDEATALAWGQEISERFIQLLYRDESLSWRQASYANWTEAPADPWPDEQRVKAGEFPDFAPWLRPYDGETKG